MIDLLAIALTPAGGAILASVLLALTTGSTMSLLYIRRLRDERVAETRDEHDKAVSRQLLLLSQRHDVAIYTPLPAIGVDQAMRVFSHLLQLVRGEDRDRLLTLADRLDLPDAAIANLANLRPAHRVNAIRILEQFPIPRVVTALQSSMGDDPDHDVRLEAAAALARVGQLPPPLSVIKMLDLRTRGVNRLHAAIFRACAVKHRVSLETLTQDLTLGVVRPLLVDALGWSEDFAVHAVLSVHAVDNDPEIRAAALRAARKLSYPGVASWVLPMLFDPVEHVRVQAARTSGALGLREAIPVLATLIGNPSWWVRTRAAEALALLRPAQPSPFSKTGLRT